MFKRLSILEKRPGDDQAFFSRHWQERHGPLVARLPAIRAYVQNHVEERFGPPVVRVNGIVELHFDDPTGMAEAFAPAVSGDVAADEPRFLGRSAGYMVGDSPIRTAGPGGGKLVVVAVRGKNGDPLRKVDDVLPDEPGFLGLIRDDVMSTVSKADATAPPQAVDTFLHVYFADVEAARRAGSRIADRAAAHSGLDVLLTRTVRIV